MYSLNVHLSSLCFCLSVSSCLSLSLSLSQVVALEGILHLGAIKSGLASATRIAQGRSVRLVTKQQLPMQVDGKCLWTNIIVTVL